MGLPRGPVATTPRTLEPGSHHVAAVRRADALAIFVDGREAAVARGATVGSIATAAPLRVGEDEAGRYHGAIEGFRCFDRALEPREVNALAAIGPSPAATAVHGEEART